MVETDETKDKRVGWVYGLSKDELAKELRTYRLETGGIVEVMRKRFIHFLRTGEGQLPADPTPVDPGAAAGGLPQTQTSPPTQPTLQVQPAANPIPRAQICDSVRKWGIKFDGQSDPISFLERVQELRKCYNFSEPELLVALPELLKDKVLLWYRNNQTTWRTWDNFVRDFKAQYLPPRFQFWLAEEIRSRTQGQNETMAEFVTALQTIMRRHGELDPVQQLERIYGNLKPEYKMYIRRRDFQTLAELLKLGGEYEALQSATNMFCPPPAPAQAYIFETAYNNKKMRSPGVCKPTNIPVGATQPSAEPSHLSLQGAQAGPGEEVQKVSAQGILQQNPQGGFSRQRVCWRCGRPGHWRTQCKYPAKLFCSWCGRQGVFSRDCTCRQSGNASGQQEN